MEKEVASPKWVRKSCQTVQSIRQFSGGNQGRFSLEPEDWPTDAYLTADSVNFLWWLKDLFLQARESALIVHLQQLQSPAAIPHL